MHAYTVTFRLVTLNLGVESLPLLGIRSDTELVNAAIASDISLIGVMAATLLVAHQAQRNQQLHRETGGNSTPLDPFLGQIISVLCLVIGTYALLKFGYVSTALKARGQDISAIDIGRLEESAYPIVIAGFAMQGAILQLALRGFNFWRTALFAALLTLSSINLERSAFVLGLLLAFLVYQTWRNQNNIPPKAVPVLIALALVWFVFKPVANAIRSGSSISEAIASGNDYFHDSLRTQSLGDLEFFDMQASYMAASDEAGKRFYGATLLPLLYIPIPRFTWPDKPRMNDWELELSSSQRPFYYGAVPTFSGESYVNFGWFGCAVLPFLYIFLMQAGYDRVRAHSTISSGRFLYLVFLVSMIQVYRDGLESIFTYPFITYLPLTVAALISMGLSNSIVQRGETLRQAAMHPARTRPI
ncbi:MAG TPA: O-antigen polymerase [Terracidiphilus sp.]|nr:O-antigen polymerase [Terracidiphilus sp.]